MNLFHTDKQVKIVIKINYYSLLRLVKNNQFRSRFCKSILPLEIVRAQW